MANIHEHYDQMTDQGRAAVDEAFRAMRQSLRISGYSGLANDDNAERMVNAIAKYVIDSRAERHIDEGNA